MSSDDDVKDIFLLLRGLVLLGLLLVVLVATWPVFPLLAVALAGWRLTRGRDAIGWKALHEFLGPVAAGLAVLCASLLLLNAFALGQSWPLAVEDWVVRMSLRLCDVLKVRPGAVIGGLACLLLVSFAAPRLKLVSRVIELRGAMDKVCLFLMVITSFSLSSALPIEHWQRESYLRRFASYEENLDREHRATDRRRVLAALDAGAHRLTSADLANLQQLLASIAAQVPSADEKEVVRGVLRAGLGEDVDAASPGAGETGEPPSSHDAAKLRDEPVPDAVLLLPTDERKLDEAERQVHEAGQRADQAERRMEESRAALAEFLSTVVSATIPELHPVLNAYIDDLVDVAVKRGVGAEAEGAAAGKAKEILRASTVPGNSQKPAEAALRATRITDLVRSVAVEVRTEKQAAAAAAAAVAAAKAAREAVERAETRARERAVETVR